MEVFKKWIQEMEVQESPDSAWGWTGEGKFETGEMLLELRVKPSEQAEGSIEATG